MLDLYLINTDQILRSLVNSKLAVKLFFLKKIKKVIGFVESNYMRVYKFFSPSILGNQSYVVP